MSRSKPLQSASVSEPGPPLHQIHEELRNRYKKINTSNSSLSEKHTTKAAMGVESARAFAYAAYKVPTYKVTDEGPFISSPITLPACGSSASLIHVPFKIERNGTGNLHTYFVYVYRSDLAEIAKEARSALVAAVQVRLEVMMMVNKTRSCVVIVQFGFKMSFAMYDGVLMVDAGRQLFAPV
ncbi:hypothetical protein LTS18_001498 [Coniosporium uncinatum]|uniref:Uncharacterized protein n=1 Tax=Coniosporium uncinatum TaxID=93489 RepID=A0ACC3DUT2_9PEZI|nr:hypothetical protein LTS18_001498 [Coniosporium uncinatum]